jgi:hypothetical protein
MKLRHKETGEIVEARSFNSAGMICIYYENKADGVGRKDCFKTLAKLNEKWEDYKSKEPLIKDKGIVSEVE